MRSLLWMYSKAPEGAEPVLATVEYSDIRGLVTVMTFFRRGAASGLHAGVGLGWAYPLGWSRILLSVVAPLRLPWNHMPV
jgi:hypothetical protein